MTQCNNIVFGIQTPVRCQSPAGHGAHCWCYLPRGWLATRSGKETPLLISPDSPEWVHPAELDKQSFVWLKLQEETGSGFGNIASEVES